MVAASVPRLYTLRHLAYLASTFQAIRAFNRKAGFLGKLVTGAALRFTLRSDTHLIAQREECGVRKTKRQKRRPQTIAPAHKTKCVALFLPWILSRFSCSKFMISCCGLERSWTFFSSLVQVTVVTVRWATHEKPTRPVTQKSHRSKWMMQGFTPKGLSKRFSPDRRGGLI